MKRVLEQDCLPYRVSPLPPGPWLIFAAHADDETLGLGGLMLLAREQGINMQLVILTDGAAGGANHDGSLTAVREKEAERVAARLGIDGPQFWRQPDRQLSPNPSLVSRVARTVRRGRPAVVFFPAITEFHPDHRAAAGLVWQGLESGGFSGRRMAYEISHQAMVNHLFDITAVEEEKAALVHLYASQTGQNNYLDVIRGLNRSRTFSLPPGIRAAEGCYEYPPRAGLTHPLKRMLALYGGVGGGIRAWLWRLNHTRAGQARFFNSGRI